MEGSTLVYRGRWSTMAGVQAYLPDLIRAFATAPAGFPGDEVATILAELLANLRNAGLSRQPEGRAVAMQVTVRALLAEAVVIVADTGVAFDPLSHGDAAAALTGPALMGNEGTVADSGRGLPIVMHLCVRPRHRRWNGCNVFACRVPSRTADMPLR